MRESIIQSRVTRDARSKGWTAYKWSSPGRRAVPDYIYVKNAVWIVIEYKATGETPTDAQLYEHKQLAKQGIIVHVIDSIEDGVKLFT